MILALGTLLGGIGLFLLGMLHLTEGLKQSAGERLDQYLQSGTNTKKRGFFSGFTLTSLVQSSSVVTVATIGFANAGLLTLGQSAWVVFGSNVGTTMTGWIVAIVGFKIKVEIFALPLVGIGAFVHILGKSSRLKAIGSAVAGFGLLFVGLNLLQSALTEYQGSFAFTDNADFNAMNISLFIGIGVAMTMVMQSSSASMAMILTLVNAGAIPLALGAAAVIGANVGTTSTAILATIGATPNAKRVAWVHVIFNLAAGIAALLLLPLVSEVFTIAYDKKLMGGNAAFWLAIYHSLFNLLGVALMIPLEPKVSHFLEKRFIAEQRDTLLLKFIDKTTVAMPPIAAQSAYRELEHFQTILVDILQHPETSEAQESTKQMDALLSQYDEHLATTLRQTMADDLAKALSLGIKCSQNISNVLMLHNELRHSKNIPKNKNIIERLKPVRESYLILLNALETGQSVKETGSNANHLSKAATHANDELFQLMKSEAISGNDIHIATNWINHHKRIGRILMKFNHRLNEINQLINPSDASDVSESDEAEDKAAQYL